MTYEARVTKIEKTLGGYRFHVDKYKLGNSFDEYEESGYVYHDNVEDFDPEDSVALFEKE